MTASKDRVLVVDDEPQVLVALEDLLSDEFVVIKAESAEHALRVAEQEPDLAVVVTDQRMPQMSGDELLVQLQGRTHATRMMLTGFADLSAVVRGVNEGRIFAYVAKPWQADDLKLKVQHAAQHFRLAQELDLERRLLHDLMDSMPDGIYFKDQELRFLRANRALLQRFALEPSALVGKRLAELLDEPQARVAEAEERGLLASGEPLLDQVRPERRDGVERWFSESKAPVRGPEGQVAGIVGISRDVTQRKAHESRIARLTSVQALISGINTAIVRLHDRDELLAAACRLAVTSSELSVAVVARVSPETGEVRIVACEPLGAQVVKDLESRLVQGRHDSELLRQLFAAPKPFFINDIASDPRLRYRDLMLGQGLASAAVIPLKSGGKVDSVWCLFSRQQGFFDTEETTLLCDVGDNISYALDHIGKTERLQFLAYHDELTQLPNRDVFLDRAGQLLTACRRDQSRLAVLVIDLDRFRQVNSSLGREGGDALLVEVARRLEHVAPRDATVARLFGNTFALLVPTDGESEIGSFIENELLAAFRQPFTISASEVVVSLRTGVAMYPSDGDSGETLLANAEAASKRAKASGTGFVFYAPSMNARVAEQLALETKLRRATERDEFLLHYQPKIDLKTGRVVGMEALIRWRDPDKGLVPPGKFIPLLEETGLIREVGQWVLERAARQYRDWAAAGLSPPRIAVNVSGLQLAAADFVASLDRALGSEQIWSAGVDLEITESVFVDDLEGSIAKLRAARERGLTISMDDFGTGYSSLSSLGRLPLDSLKVDQSFVRLMMESAETTSIVTAIISLAHALDLTVVAEGVETVEQARLLRLLKCDQAQGYLIARPVPAEQIPALLSAQFDLKRASGSA